MLTYFSQPKVFRWINSLKSYKGRWHSSRNQNSWKTMEAFFLKQNEVSKKNCQIVAKCEHEFYSTLYKVCTWVLLNTLLQFHKFFLTLCIFVVFYNVNTVRSEMWVWGFPNHSCQKFFTNHSSSTRDLTRFLAFVIWKTQYSHFLLTVLSQYLLT